MAFTDELWDSIAPIYATILKHPFVRGLSEGSLPRDAMRHRLALSAKCWAKIVVIVATMSRKKSSRGRRV